MCSTHFPLSGRILLLALPTSNNFAQFMCAEIPGVSAWAVPFRLPWCRLLLWQLQFIRAGFWAFDVQVLATQCRKFLYFVYYYFVCLVFVD